MHWNYRIHQKRLPQEFGPDVYSMRATYYNDASKVWGFSQKPFSPTGASIEELEECITQLLRDLRKNKTKPPLHDAMPLAHIDYDLLDLHSEEVIESMDAMDGLAIVDFIDDEASCEKETIQKHTPLDKRFTEQSMIKTSELLRIRNPIFDKQEKTILHPKHVQYYLVNMNCNMSFGKIAAQCAHGAQLMEQQAARWDFHEREIYDLWSIASHMKKVVLRAKDKDLNRALNTYNRSIEVIDMGFNEVSENTRTVVVLPPMTQSDIPSWLKRLQTL